MSSKILKNDERRRAEPFVWASVGLEVAACRRGQAVETGPEQQLERRIREARREGFQEGEAAGKKQVEPVMQRLAAAIEELATLRPRLRREAEGDLLKLSLAIARRILRRELTVDPGAVAGLVKAALERLQGLEVCRVRVDPGLEAVLRACLGQAGPAAAIEIVADPGRAPGTLIFETSQGNLDASIETQLGEIERGLADRLRRRP